MSLGEILIFADKYDRRNPKLLGFMLLEAFANDLGFPDIGAWRA